MDTTHQDAYSQHTGKTQPVVQPDTNNILSTDADQAVRLMAQLFQAQQPGNLADVTSQLQGPQAQQLMQILQLAKTIDPPSGAGQDTSSAHPDTASDSEPDSTAQSGTDSESVTTDASDHHRRRRASRNRLAPSQAQQMLEQSDKDVIIIDEQMETVELETVRLTPGWERELEHEEASWPTRFPVQKPFIKPRVEQVDDKWYQGEDCVDPSGIAPPAARAILPAADGTLSLRRDAAMPGASRGRTVYKTHDLVRRLSYKKGERIENKLARISSAEPIGRDHDQKELFAADEFWKTEIQNSLYVPGPDDTPVNFAYRSGLGRIEAIPYRVAAPMAWEYPYAYGQLQESLTDRLVTASLYGIQLVRPGYYSPQAGPDAYSEAEWQRRKSQACANYVLDTDTSECDYSPPQGSIGITPSGEEAFTCREVGCGAMPDMPCYFATAEQYTAHWNTFHVAVAPSMTCMVRGCGVKFPPRPDSLDAFFRHCKEKHEAESDGCKWTRLRNWARKGIDIWPNPHYSALGVDEPICPSRSRGRGRGTSRGVGAKRNRRAPQTSSGLESESQGELNPQTILDWGSGSEPRSSRDPGNERGRSRRPGGRTGPSSRGTAQSADRAGPSSEESAPGLTVALFKKGHKRKKSRSRCNSRDRRKRPSGQSGSEETGLSSEESVIPPQPKLPSSATQGITPRPSGAGSTYTRRTVGDDCEPLGGRTPGDGTVPRSALSVETLDGQLVYEGTKEKPIIKFETCQAELKSMGKAMRLWTVDLLEVEIAGLKNKSRPGGPWSPWQNTLPRLPEWGSPNRWDYWGRPWAYMDAPNKHPAIKVQSAHHKLTDRVTIAVLVNCEREPQYFPNLDVAKSAAAGPTWRGHMARVIDGSGNLNLKITVPRAARMVQPPHFEGPNVAVEALFNTWDSFRASKVMWRPNPEMPWGDVTPEGCRRTLTVAQLSEHRPVKSVPPSQPLHLPVTPAAPHVDKSAFPALPSSSRDGIGGIPGSKDFPKGTTEGFQAALKKPDEDTVVPRAASGRTSVPPSTTTPVTTSSPAVTTAVTTSATTTTSAPGSSTTTVKTTLDPQVTVIWLSPKLVESARIKLTAKANLSQIGQGKADSKAPSQEEAMDIDISHGSGHRSSSHVHTQCSRSHSMSRDSEKRETKGKTSSAPVPHRSRETERKSSRPGSTAVGEVLLKAGGVQPPRPDVGPMQKYTPGKEYKVDYSKEPCPPPAFQLDQPRGPHLEGAPEQPKLTWHADPNMSMATLQGHLQALAQAGSQHALYRSEQGMLRTRTEAMRIWGRSNDAFRQIAREPVFVDEGHAGTVMASHAEAQRRNAAMKG